MLEREIEEYFKTKVRSLGGEIYKFVSPGRAGVPDRIVMFPGGVIAFVELKAPGEGLRPQQRMHKRRLERMGQDVFVVDGINRADITAGLLFDKSARIVRGEHDAVQAT